MAAPEIERLVVAGPGEPLPAAFLKLDANDAKLQSRADAHAARLALLERGVRPVGFAVGGAPAEFLYASVSPVALAQRGRAGIPGGPAIDSDGKLAIVRLSATRFVAVALEGVSASNGTLLLRATVYEVAAGGGVTTLAQTAFLPQATGWNVMNYAILGGFRLSDTVCRVGFTFNYSAQIAQNSLATLSYDPVANTLTATTDATFNVNNLQTPYHTGTMHRRRGYHVGAQSGFIPRIGAAVNVSGNPIAAPGGWLVDRLAGATGLLVRHLAPVANVTSHAIDKIGDSLFVVLSDGWAVGAGLGAQIMVSALDDVTAGPVSMLRLGNGMTGNARLTAVSPTLFVLGFTTGTQFATYLVRRDPATNQMRVVGAPAIAGVLGTVPLEVVPLGPTRALVLWKNAGWTLQGSVVDVNPDAPDGASALTAGAAFSWDLGTHIAGALAADNVVVGAIEQLSGDRLLVAYRNTTRANAGLEILDLV